MPPFSVSLESPLVSFTQMNLELRDSTGYGTAFQLGKFKDRADRAAGDARTTADVFSLTEGIYIIHSYYFQEEDCELQVGELSAEPSGAVCRSCWAWLLLALLVL